MIELNDGLSEIQRAKIAETDTNECCKLWRERATQMRDYMQRHYDRACDIGAREDTWWESFCYSNRDAHDWDFSA
jgi:hypothetical protein